MLLHQEFVRVAKQNGSKLAIVDSTRGMRVTYRQALARAVGLARKLESLPAGYVGIALPNSDAAVIAILAVLMSGRVPVMLNYSTGLAVNCTMAQRHCGFRTIITSRAFCERLECGHVDGMLYLEDLRKSVTLRDRLAAAATAVRSTASVLREVHAGSPDDVAVVLFTSGSEAEPKAVGLTHRNIQANIQSLNEAFTLRADDIFLANLPYFHIFGQTANIWAPFQFSMTIVTVANPLDFRGTCETVRREGVSLVAATPALFQGYLRGSNAGDFASCRLFMTAADRCPDRLHAAFFEKHGKILLEAYGATETSPAISANTPEYNKQGSVGRPLVGVQVRILDEPTGRACRTGENGRILVRGDSVMRGYLNDPKATDAVLRDGWYDTGDLGYLDADGFLWLTGRLRRFAKIGGEMVSLVRVEQLVEQLLPEGHECCVVEVPDESRGSQLVAVVTTNVREDDVLLRLAEQLPRIALPARFLVVESLPKSPTGKVDFRGLTESVRRASSWNS